jgi:hypothetical protein
MNMKKWIALILSVLMLAGLLPMAAFAESPETPDFTGSWSDPEFDRAQIVILRDFEAWSDDMLGETPGGNYIISMTWTNSADSFDSYRMTAHEDGTGLVYDNGLYVRYTSLDDENNEAEFLEDQGKGRFTLTEDGVLKWEDSYLGESAEMNLVRETVNAPSAETLAEGYFRPVTFAEAGAAGGELKIAAAVNDVYSFCFENAIWLVKADELGPELLAAHALLTKEELEAFDAAEPAVTEEALRLLQENEKLTDAYYDAGVAEHLESLREDASVRCSVSSFLAFVTTLENYGEN